MEFGRNLPFGEFRAELVAQECAAGVTLDAQVIRLLDPLHQFDVLVENVVVASESFVVHDRMHTLPQRAEQLVDSGADRVEIGRAG